MTRTRWIWLTAAVLYTAFFSWYTSFGGPLTEQEIDKYMAFFEQRGIEPEQKRVLEQFLRSDTGDDFAMINVIDMYATPLQVPGVEPGESSDEYWVNTCNTCIPRCSLVPAIRFLQATRQPLRWT